MEYYVASLSRWFIFHANNAREALEQAEQYPDFQGHIIMTIRKATRDEIIGHEMYQKMKAWVN